MEFLFPAKGMTCSFLYTCRIHYKAWIMRLTCLLFAIGCTGLQLLMAHPGHSQDLTEVRVTLELKNEPLKMAFARIERQTDFRFAYNREQIDHYRSITLARASYPLQKALELLLANTHLSFKQVSNKIIIYQADDTAAKQAAGELAASLVVMEDGSIKGKITNDKGEPVVGASVLLVGADKGTAAGLEGEFAIVGVKPGKYKLQVSAIGFQNIVRDITVADGQALELNFQLKAGGNAMDEVVVTGYSRQSKRDVTGAASTISADVVAQTPATDVTGVLQGRVAGVSVDGQGGPGSSQTIRIRGVSTFGNNDPLYVIDGVQIRMGASSTPGSQDISNLLNPSDIETITILKDPSLIGLYGSEGSNGVIVITTKTGKPGAPKLEYSSYVGKEVPKKLPSIITPQQQANALYNSYLNSTPSQTPKPASFYGSGTTPVLPDYIIEGGSPNIGVMAGDPAANPSLYNYKNYRILKTNKAGTNWFKELFKPALTQNHQLTLSGASDKSNYALTFGYLNDQGTELNSFFKRYSLRVNTQFKVKPWLRVGENVEMSYADMNSGQKRTFNTFNNDMGALYALSPLLPTHDIAGNLAGTKGTTVLGGGSPLTARVNSLDSKASSESIIGSAYLEAGPVKGVTYTSQIGFQFLPGQYHYYTPGLFQEPLADTANVFAEGGGYSTDWRWLNKLSYALTLNSIHKITAFVGYEAHQFTYRNTGASTGNLANPSPNTEYLSSGNTGTGAYVAPTIFGGGDKYTSTSIFGNATYSLLDKYLLAGTYRRDGSSKFGINSTFVNFGAVSAGWRISKEKFMESVAWVNELKLRGSYGSAGNDAIQTGAYSDTYSSDPFGAYDLGGTNTSSMSGYYLSSFGNSRVHWETNKTTNIGFDAALFNNKLTASFNWFDKATKGLLYAPTISGTQGSAASAIQNIMNFSNKGVELELGYGGRVGPVRFDMNFNFSTYRNKVTYIDGVPSTHIDGGAVGSGGGTFLTRSVVGRPISSFYGYEYEGLFQNAQDVANHAAETSLGINATNALGHVKYKDLNNSQAITDSDRTFLGDPNPKFTYGYNLNLYYKNFDLGILVQGVYGNKIFNYGRVMTQMPNGLITGQGGLQAGALDTWTPSNPNAKLPIYDQNSGVNDLSPSSFYIESGSYFRVKMMQLGYTLPKINGISRLRIYVQAYNLLTITHYSGMDPEVNDGNPRNIGIDYGTAYPIAQKFLAGINLGL
jgi:TonB-dependent starch-binding outer membrane protein SusC